MRIVVVGKVEVCILCVCDIEEREDGGEKTYQLVCRRTLKYVQQSFIQFYLKKVTL
jgi:hypothetical protein